MSADSVLVERTCSSPEEFAFLVEIVENLTDDSRRLVYADWLEDRGDSRGQFLQSFLKAFHAEQKLPSFDGMPAAWLDVTGLTIIQKIAESGLYRWRDELLALARPALRLEVGKADFGNPPRTPEAIGTTRLGGDPDLPVGTVYPTAADGVPLHFLSQFNLADLQGTIAGCAFPAAGLLSIFRPQSDGKNCYPTRKDCPRLVRLAPPGTKLARLSRPTDQMDPPAPFRPDLRLVETMRLPAASNEWPGVTLTYEQESALDKIFPTNLGGTAYMLLGHVTHGNIGDEPIKDRPDWLQLVLVPYFEGPDYGISDMSLSYQLPASDLKAGRFDRLEATFG